MNPAVEEQFAILARSIQYNTMTISNNTKVPRRAHEQSHHGSKQSLSDDYEYSKTGVRPLAYSGTVLGFDIMLHTTPQLTYFFLLDFQGGISSTLRYISVPFVESSHVAPVEEQLL